jgi:O-antigen/teichoic acid export membrane protein
VVPVVLNIFRSLFPEVGSLKRRVFTAGAWVLGGFAAAQFLRIFGNLILTRLLVPDVFGIMALASAFQIVIGLLTDVGLRPSIMQSQKGEDKSFLDTAWTVQVTRGWLMWFGCLAVSAVLHLARLSGWLPPGSVYAHPDLPLVLSAVSFSSVISGFQSIKLISLNRKLDMKRITYIELIQMIIGLVVAIGLAWLTRSIWSFVLNTLFGALVTTMLSRYWLPGRKDRFGWNREALIEIVRFGRWIFLSSMIGVLAMNGDRLLLAAWATPAILGYYSIAANLAMVVENTANRIFGSVSLPALSEIGREQRHRFQEIYFRMKGLSDSAFIAMAGFLFAAGEGVIRLLFDERYAPAGEMLHLLSFGLMFSRYGLVQNAYNALGRPNYVAAINFVKVISLFVLVPSFYLVLGIPGAIIGIAFYLVPTVPLILWFNRELGLNNLKLELVVLAAWPLGWLIGTAFSATLQF